MTARTLLIGLDGATFSVLDPLIADGVMPSLAKLFASGVRAELLSVIPPLTPPAWTSLMTGRNPGNHGVFDFLRFENGLDGRQLRVTDSRDVSCETIWSMVSRQGLKATVLNFPLTFPAPDISGHVVPGWVPWRHLRLACRPKTLYDQLSALPGFNARELAMDMSLEEKALEGCHHEEDYEQWITLHIRRERQWFNVLRHLMREQPADLTAVLFDGVDKLQHFCWRFLDPTLFPATPTAWETKIRELCLDYFREIDGFIGEVIGMAGPQANVVVASDHGFGSTVEVFYLNAWLHQHGYLAWTERSAPQQEHPETLGLGTMARRFYEIDWSRTTAYCPTPSSNGIYLPRAAENGGSGIAGQSYESFRRELMDALLKFVDPATGEPVVTRIWTREEAFAGKHMLSAPDLTLSLRDGGFVSILPSDVVVKPRAQASGTHRPNGVFAASGPGIRRGLAVNPLSIVDIAPLILHTLGLPVPDDLEGRVHEALFEPSHIRSHPVVVGAPTETFRKPAQQASDTPEALHMEAEVLKQLKALGYME